jgi:hypothetical protein
MSLTARLWRASPLATLVLILSLLVTRLSYLAAYPFSGLAPDTVAYGLAQPPASHRILAPWMARAALELTDIGQFVHWNFVVQMLFCVAALGATYAFLRLFHSRTWSLVGLLIAPVVMLWSIDMPAADSIPQVFFFALAFICLQRKRPALFALVYLVALVNRETIAALLLPFLVVFWADRSRWRAIAWTAGLLACTLGWKFYLAPAYLPGGRGPAAEFQLMSNIRSLADIRHVFNPFAKNPFTILGYTYLFVRYAWRDLAPFARTLCVSFLPYLLLMTVVARLSETRVYVEWTPIAALVAVAALARFAGTSDEG